MMSTIDKQSNPKPFLKPHHNIIVKLVVSFSIFRSDAELPGWAVTMETEKVSSDRFRCESHWVFVVTD